MALPRPRRRPGGRVARQVKCPPPGAAVARHRVAVPASAVSRTPAVAPAVAVAATTRAAAMVVVVVVATPAAAGVAIVGVVATPAAGVARRAAAGAHRAVAADITKSWYFTITVTYSGVRDSGFGIRGGRLRFGSLFCNPEPPIPNPACIVTVFVKCTTEPSKTSRRLRVEGSRRRKSALVMAGSWIV